MKSFHSTALAASILGLCAFSQGASAATVSITSEVFTGNAPLEAATPAPVSTTGTFSQSATSSITAVELSPYAFNTGSGADGSAAATGATYSVLGASGGVVSTATYNIDSSSLTFLWGSPDSYNQIAFFSGPNGTGSLLDTITGSNLACSSSTCKETLFDLVTFAVSGGGTIGSIVLTDLGSAFEFGFTTPPPVAATPLPAGLPLFATGLGSLGLLGWRRKRRKAA